jgi:hypothetical protein
MILASSLVLTSTLLGPPSASAAPILFTDKAAFLQAAQPGSPLGVTNFEILPGPTARVVYGDILPVLFDTVALGLSPCQPSPFVATCTTIPFGGPGIATSFTTVQPFLTPVLAAGYDVRGTFQMFGQTYQTVAPVFFGFIFEQPTTVLPLPQFVNFELQQSTFFVQDVVVSTPEPATLWLLGITAAALVTGRRTKAA